MKKALYFDTETTGLNSWKNDIIQFACMVEINGEIVEEWETKVMPLDFTSIEPKALEVNGLTMAMLKTYPHPREIHQQMCKLFGKYISKFDKVDKFAPIGYNVKFDVDFLQNFFKKCDDKYYGSWFSWRLVDPIYTLYEMDYMREIALPDYKLSTVCAHFGIPLKAHDALSDIRATRELLKLLQQGRK